MFNRFDLDNNEDLERLLDYLKKDKFNSLSIIEQNEVLDAVIELLRTDNNSSRKIGYLVDSNDFRNVDVNKIIDRMGYQNFKEELRNAISEGGVQFSHEISKLSPEKLEELLEKAENNELSEEEVEKLINLTNLFDFVNDPNDVNFSAYGILKLYCGVLKKVYLNEEKNQDLNLLSDAEPFITAAYVSLFSAFISHQDNSVSRMYEKRGIDKTKIDIEDLTNKFTNLIIDYSKENDIAPERTTIALLNIVRMLVSPLNTSIDYPADEIEEKVENIHVKLLDLKDTDKDDKESNKSNKSGKNDRPTKSANADKKESKNNDDLKKLLLDD